ncbi:MULTISPECIES: DMT family transporter [unclassified Vibrio]|uniref:DMT family transporter n=1 Tax=Vibrio sp. HB236076 TaxID=3232307 RepID=A0AB39HFM2_9VIBR|nr:DMT family transporter [Vibrio sp. HB161653]MDP5254991.1 DMT family transporter [Vibrio sp. HB161653]
MPQLYILGSAIGFGLTPSLIQILLQQNYSAEVLAFFRFGLPALLCLPWLLSNQYKVAELLRTLLVGALSGIGMLCYYALFYYVPASTLILCYYSYPLFSMLIAYLAFGSSLTRNRLICSFLILVAMYISLNAEPFSSLDYWQWVAVWLPPISFAILINYFSNPVEPMKPKVRMAASLTGNVIVLLPFIVWLQPIKMLPTSGHEWLWVILLAGLSAAVPQYLFAKGSQSAGQEQTTLIGSSEIVFAMVFSHYFLNTPLTKNSILAALIIIAASLIRLEKGKASVSL